MQFQAYLLWNGVLWSLYRLLLPVAPWPYAWVSSDSRHQQSSRFHYLAPNSSKNTNSRLFFLKIELVVKKVFREKIRRCVTQNFDCLFFYFRYSFVFILSFLFGFYSFKFICSCFLSYFPSFLLFFLFFYSFCSFLCSLLVPLFTISFPFSSFLLFFLSFPFYFLCFPGT